MYMQPQNRKAREKENKRERATSVQFLPRMRICDCAKQLNVLYNVANEVRTTVSITVIGTVTTIINY